MTDPTKPFDPELAIKLSKLVHDQCDRPPHDIGASLAQIVQEHIKPRTPAEAEEMVEDFERTIGYDQWDRVTGGSEKYEAKRAALIAALTGGGE